MVRFKGARPRIHQPLGYVHRNPLVERRSRRGGTPTVTEVDSEVGWDVVGFLPGNPYSGAFWMRNAIDVNTQDNDAEIVIYHIGDEHMSALSPSGQEQLDTHYQNWKSPDENDAALKNAYDFAKENADYIVRGMASDDVYSGGNMYPSTEGWRTILRNFVDPPLIPNTLPNRDVGYTDAGDRILIAYRYSWERLLWSTPVSVDGKDPVRLDVALLRSKRAVSLYRKLVATAYWVRDYSRTNADSVADYIDGYIGAFTSAALAGECYSAGPYGAGNVTRGSPARDRMLKLIERVQEESTDNHFWHDFGREVRDQIRHNSTLWHRADEEVSEDGAESRALVNERGRPWRFPEDDEKHYVYFTYETEDRIEDQLDNRTVDEALILAQDEGWDALLEVRDALEEVEVHWDIGAAAVPNLIRVGEVDAHWCFTIDMDDLEEWVEEKSAELHESEDEEEEDDDA